MAGGKLNGRFGPDGAFEMQVEFRLGEGVQDVRVGCAELRSSIFKLEFASTARQAADVRR